MVVEPLPKPFEITTNITTQVVPEVISVAGLEPTDLGYATFSFEVVNTLEFWVAGFAYDSELSDLELTEFEYSVTPAGGTTLSGSAEAITNMILVRGEEDTYEVSFEKEGYVIISNVKTTYTQAELAAYTREHPLKLIFNNTLSEGLVVHYTFDGNIDDQSGNDVDLTSYGDLDYSTDRKGNTMSAYSADGNDYLDAGQSVVDGFPVTISYWFKNRSAIATNSSWNIASNYYGVGVNSIVETATTSSFRFALSNFTGAGSGGRGPDGRYSYVTAANTYEADTWVHAVIVIKGVHDRTTYINGQEISYETTSGTNEGSSFNEGVLRLMFAYDTPIAEKGEIDDVRIYNRAVTEKEVSLLYNE